MIHVDNGCDVDNDSGKLDTSQDFPGNRPWDGQGSDSEYEFPSEGIIIVELPQRVHMRYMSVVSYYANMIFPQPFWFKDLQLVLKQKPVGYNNSIQWVKRGAQR